MHKKVGAVLTSIAVSMVLWTTRINALFGGKTELELNGIDVIKESAEILARTAKMFPTHKMVVSIIGFIMFAQGLSFFCLGLITLISGNESTSRARGMVMCSVGLSIATLGALCSLFSFKIAYFIFSK